MESPPIIGYVLGGVWLAGACVAAVLAHRRNHAAQENLEALHKRDLSKDAQREQESAINSGRQRTAGYIFAIAAVGSVIASIQAKHEILSDAVMQAVVWGGVVVYCGAAYYLMHWFVMEVWAELKRVVWPTKEETYSFTAVVIWAVVITGLYMGTLDYIFTTAIALLHLYD